MKSSKSEVAVAVLFMAVVFLVVPTGCKQPNQDADGQTIPPVTAEKTGSLELSFFGEKSLSNAAVATIVERLKGQIYEVRLNLENADREVNLQIMVNPGERKVTVGNIPVGSYDLTVDMYNAQSRIFNGLTSVTVLADQMAFASVAVEPTPYTFNFYVYNFRGNFQQMDGSTGCVSATFDLGDGTVLDVEPKVYGYDPNVYSCWFKVELPLSQDWGKLTLIDYDYQPVEVELYFDWFVLQANGGTIWTNAESNGDVQIQITLPDPGAAYWELHEFGSGSSAMTIDIGAQNPEELFGGTSTEDPLAILLVWYYWRGQWYQSQIDPTGGFPLSLSFAFVPEQITMTYQTASDQAAYLERSIDSREWLGYYNGQMLECQPGLDVWQLANQYIHDGNGTFYLTLQEAVDYSTSSDIYVGEGSYNGFVMPANRYISIHGLTANKTWLINRGDMPNVIYASAMGGPYPHKGGGAALIMENIGIYNMPGQIDAWYSDAAVFVEGGIFLRMNNCVVESQSNKCISLNYQTAEIHHCVLIGYMQQSYAIASYHGSLMADTSVVKGCSEAFHIEYSTVQSKLNCLYENTAISNDPAFLTPGYIFADPMLGCDYAALIGSPCLNGAGPGIDIGLDYAPPY